MTGCCARDYEKMFGRKAADREARRFRKRGLRGSAKELAGLAGDVRGKSVLEIGGGAGTIEIALLEAGAARATNIELAATYEAVAEELLAERGLNARVERRVGDFVADAATVGQHDVVIMHRVVCCYPDVEALVGAAADHADRRMVLTYPQERAIIRAGFRLGNAMLRLRGSTFRAYVHPVRRIEAAAEVHGLAPEARVRHGLVWESAAFSAAR